MNFVGKLEAFSCRSSIALKKLQIQLIDALFRKDK